MAKVELVVATDAFKQRFKGISKFPPHGKETENPDVEPDVVFENDATPPAPPLLALGVITTRPSGGAGPATWQTVTLDANGNTTASGTDIPVVIPHF